MTQEPEAYLATKELALMVEVLRAMDDLGRPPLTSELKELLSGRWSQGHLSVVLARLTDKGYIEREPAPEDLFDKRWLGAGGQQPKPPHQIVPLVDRRDLVRREIQHVLETRFQGAPELTSAFLEETSRRLTEEGD